MGQNMSNRHNGASMLSGETITLAGKSDVMWAMKPGEIEDAEKWREN